MMLYLILFSFESLGLSFKLGCSKLFWKIYVFFLGGLVLPLVLLIFARYSL